MTNRKAIKLLIMFLGLLAFSSSFQLFKSQNQVFGQQIFEPKPQQITGGSITNYENWTNDTFARSTQMVTVFDYITSNPINLKNITKKVNESTSYVIYNSRTTLYYHNQNQTAEFFLPDKIVGIADGFVEVKVVFSWVKTTGSEKVVGSGTARGYSEQIAIGFRFNENASNFTKYQLVDYLPFSCDHLALTQIDGNFTSEDKHLLMSMVSAYPNKQTLSFELQSAVALIYTKTINWFFNDKSPVTNQKFSYQWSNLDAISIIQNYNFTRDPFFFMFQNNTTLTYGYCNNIDDYPNPPYGPKIPAQKYNPTIYGGSQSYITLQFIQNLLYTAAKKNQFDTTLDRRFWGSRFFNFMAGEIYGPYPNLQKITTPQTQIAGQCQADENSISVSRFSDETLHVNITSRCSMSLLLRERVKFTEFEIKLNLQVQARAYDTYMDFWLKQYQQELNYFPTPEFPMVDKMAADKVIISALRKLFDNKLFGSGWPIYPNRLNPGIVIDDDEILIYDKPKK